MSVLEDFYYGNLAPYEREYLPRSPQKKRQDRLSFLESKLEATVTADTLKLFLVFTETYAACQSDIALDSFINGFRLGARMSYEAFVSGDTPLNN